MYETALSDLYALAPRGIEPGLDRVRDALRRIGDPQLRLRCVHVAGTNGKGSVCAMVARGLSGRVGLYTSPHICTLTERVRIAGEPVSKDEFARAYFEVKHALDALTFFEAVTVVGFHLLRDVEIAVIEVGLGGSLDATNVIDPLVCAITRIGIDHTGYLGTTLASIAAEKAGILKAGVPAIVAPQPSEAMEAIEDRAAQIGAPLVRVGREIEVSDAVRIRLGTNDLEARPRLIGAHQHANAAVAAGVLWTLETKGFAVDVRAAIETVSWPGRLEEIESFLLDAAHNVDGCEALAAFLASPPRDRVLIFGAMRDKEWRDMIAILRPHVRAIVYAAPSLARAEDPDVLAAHEPGHVAQSIDEAIAIARELAVGAQIVVAGSMYLMAAVRARLLGLEQDPPIAM